MKNMTLGAIAKSCNGTFYGPEEAKQIEVKGIERDSRKIEEGWLFIALPGAKVDGHDFIPQVFSQGAAGVVCEKKPAGVDGVCIVVEDTAKAMRDIAAFYRSTLKVKVVGITGSVGKTSTKEMIASVLSVKYKVQKTAGNFNNEVGLPLTVFSIGEEHEIAVLEMGISDFGEMHRLGAIARPDLMVITNIGQCHLENLGTRDGILKAKTEVFDEMNPEGDVILNVDDDKLSTIEQVHGRRPYGFSREKKDAYAYCSNVEAHGLKGSTMVLHVDGKSMEVHVPLPGEHMVTNAVAAAAVGSRLGLSIREIAEGIGQVQAVAGRGKMIDTPDYTLIDECYNANPASMRAAMDLLAQADTRTVAILGDMFELGTDSDQLHRGVGAYAAKKGIDLICCIGENARYIYEGAEKERAEGTGTGEIYWFQNKQEFLEKKDELLRKGDSVLLKASHGMEFPVLLAALQK